MRAFFDSRQLSHAPLRELHNGGFVDFAETPARAQAIAAAIGPVDAPADYGIAPILAVHDAGYVDFLLPHPWSSAACAAMAAVFKKQ